MKRPAVTPGRISAAVILVAVTVVVYQLRTLGIIREPFMTFFVRYPAMFSVPDGKIAIYGLMPDGVSSTRMQLASGEQRPVQLVNNVFYVELGASDLPQATTWEKAGRDQSREFHFPPDVGGVVCDREQP